MKRHIAFILPVFLLAATRHATAYQCQLPPLEKSYSAYTHIFSGKVIESHSREGYPFSPKDSSFYGEGADCVITVNVDHSFRGKVPNRVVLRESSKSDLCMQLPEGDRYIFFTKLREDGDLTRTRCDPTTPWSWDMACELSRLSGQSKGKKCSLVDEIGSKYGYCGRTRLRLDGLVSDGKGVRCIIDGEFYSKGDMIGKGKIIKVDMQGVTVECEGKQIGLSVSSK